MLKVNRKRKQEIQPSDVEHEILAPKNKFKPFDAQAEAEEEQLSKILFGGSSGFLKNLEEAEVENATQAQALTPDSGMGDDDSDAFEDRKPAWMDEDDDRMEVGYALDVQGRKLPKGGINDHSNQYSNLLKHKFETIVGNPKWAALRRYTNNSADSDDEILQSCGFIKKISKSKLPASTLEYKKVQDLNKESYNEGIINCIEFNPKASAALVAGNSGVATLFAVDGNRNSKLHSVAFENYPIMCAKFTNDGNEALLGSRSQYIYSYDLMAGKATRIHLPHGLSQCKHFVMAPDNHHVAVVGKWGEVYIIAARSKEKVAVLKQSNPCTALAYNPTGTLLYGHSSTGEVTVWDMNIGRVQHKWTDEGCIEGSTLAISPTNQFIAAGSRQGIVNLYNTEEVLQNRSPKPWNRIMNLRTGITNLKFNPSSEMLGFSSPDIENSVRFHHIYSATVFSNFPQFGTKLGNITSMNMSPNGGFAAFGNRKSVVSLYRLKHFKNY